MQCLPKAFHALEPRIYFFSGCLKSVSLGDFRDEIIRQKEEKNQSQYEVTHQLPVPAVGLHHVWQSVDGSSQQPLGALIVPTLQNVHTGLTIASPLCVIIISKFNKFSFNQEDKICQKYVSSSLPTNVYGMPNSQKQAKHSFSVDKQGLLTNFSLRTTNYS